MRAPSFIFVSLFALCCAVALAHGARSEPDSEVRGRSLRVKQGALESSCTTSTSTYARMVPREPYALLPTSTVRVIPYEVPPSAAATPRDSGAAPRPQRLAAMHMCAPNVTRRSWWLMEATAARAVPGKLELVLAAAPRELLIGLPSSKATPSRVPTRCVKGVGGAGAGTCS